MTSKTLVILPTFACNFRCKHCGVKKTNEINFIPLETVKRVLREAKRKKFRYVAITGGGEPLLDFEKIIKIIKLAKKYGLKVTLNTNGYFIANSNPQRIRELKNVDTIILSIDYDHLKFFPFKEVLKTVKILLNARINVWIKMVNRKHTKQRNLLLLKRLSAALNGKLINITPFRRGVSFFLILGRKIISVISLDAVKTDTNKRSISLKAVKLKDVLFAPCRSISPTSCIGFSPTITPNSNILPCCSFTAMNNPWLYKLANVDTKNKNIFDVKEPILSCILFDHFPLIKIFLKIRKDKKLLNVFLKQKYYSQCDFCFLLLKHKRKIKKIKPPTKYEILTFFVLNLHNILVNSFRYVLAEIYNIIHTLFELIQYPIKFFNRYFYPHFRYKY